MCLILSYVLKYLKLRVVLNLFASILIINMISFEPFYTSNLFKFCFKFRKKRNYHLR